MVAPSTALVSLSAQGQLLVANVASPITINLTNANGSPVPDGTEVWLTASRGALDQAKARTRDGKVAVTFMPPAQSGIVKISASSGDVQGSVEFAVASAPVGRITLTGEPASLPSGGGQVDVVATVLSTGGQAVSGAPVSFGTNTGSLTPTTAVVSDGNGQARAKLTANAASVVRANIFDQFGVELAVPLQVQASLTVTADPAGPTVGQDVVFTITLKGTGAGAASISFGDGQSKELGPVTMPATLKATHEVQCRGRLQRHRNRPDLPCGHSRDDPGGGVTRCRPAAASPIAARCGPVAASPIAARFPRRRCAVRPERGDLAAHRRQRLARDVDDHSRDNRRPADLHRSHEVRSMAGEKRPRREPLDLRADQRAVVCRDLRVAEARADVQGNLGRNHRAPHQAVPYGLVASAFG